ncbi:hypothetical protein SLG_22100 [Sphingobium sp. SYK-6]|uniref:hypothetical protein n=1 Tax=Sphingobium sp. (strain NBRC 103272 / SYK-6) TaxID=627192 RepID=UPI0002277131|nr:hypothetical protein [Sphingobium sp. SYK-6]BAK66885.1 hypothetical protein SLG_22100 [Sphingobium sp. SYK-6]
MSLADAFAGIGAAFSSALGGPFHAARVIGETDAVYDTGGSIVTPGTVSYRDCSCQIDIATDEMRRDGSYVDRDVRFIVLSASLTGNLGTEARIEVLDGPHAGTWLVSSLERDPVAIGWVGRGRKA